MKRQDSINSLAAHLFRENSGKMAAVLSRMFGLNRLDTVMDVVQDTFEAALSKWRFWGIPDNPEAWLMQVAKNKALNAFKRENKTQPYSPSLYLEHFESGIEHQFDILLSPNEIKDSQLRLLFSCCHPELSAKNQIIITLYVLCGFGIPEIANALLMNEEAVKKALARSKAALRNMNNILQTPLLAQSDERLETVHTILYLMFNEGYKTTRSKEAINKELCYEAIRLAKMLETGTSELNRETDALLALMFFNLSRFPARMDTAGEILTLAEQDRSVWNMVFIEEGMFFLKRATQAQTLSRFHLEAIISSLHCLAPTFEETDWEKISRLYRQLEKIEPSPPVTLNRIIAESYVSAGSGKLALEEIESHSSLKNTFLGAAAKGDIHQRQGEMKQARNAFETALDLAVSPQDKKLLKKKIQQIKPQYL